MKRPKFKMVRLKKPKGLLTMRQALAPKGINYKGAKRVNFKI